ncbi:guanylyl cyclase, partial [Chrysochromulina tobinii]
MQADGSAADFQIDNTWPALYVAGTDCCREPVHLGTADFNNYIPTVTVQGTTTVTVTANRIGSVLTYTKLGMSLRRDGKLLWIADEALLDEYEDDDTADSIQSIPEQPLSDDVATYYKNVFAQRSKATVLPSNMIAEMASQHSEALAEIAAAKQHARKSMSKRELKRDRRRRSLALREERLSGVSERYTEERMALLDTDSEGKWSNRSSAGSDQPPSLTSPHTAEPAIWPSDLPLSSGGFSTLKRGALPRIDSSSLALDQLEQAASAPSSAPASAPVPATAPMKSPEPRRRYGSDAFGLATTEPSAPDPNTDHGDTRPLPPRRISEFSSLHNQWARSPRDSPQEEPAAAEATRAPVWLCASNGGIVSGGSGQHSGQPHFNIGDRVEVDFDDEGWFTGVVETVRAGGRHGDRRVYNVRLDVGETADDVEGSEIRPEGVKGDSGGGSNSRDEQSTRADSLNGFDINDQASELTGLMNARRSSSIKTFDRKFSQVAAFSPLLAHWELERHHPDELVAPGAFDFESALLIVDISGFTALCTKLDIDMLQRHINTYFGELIDVVSKYDGDVLRFVGDALFCAWSLPCGAEAEGTLALATLAACRCALELHQKCSSYLIPEANEHLSMCAPSPPPPSPPPP